MIVDQKPLPAEPDPDASNAAPARSRRRRFPSQEDGTEHDRDSDPSASTLSSVSGSNTVPTVAVSDAPPGYTPPASSGTAVSGTADPAPVRPALPTNLSARPGNFMHISKANSAVRGTYVVDPTLAVPEAVLSPRAPDAGPRDNLSLESQNGSVDVDVWIVPAAVPGEPAPEKGNVGRPSVRAHSQNGSVTLRLINTSLLPVFLSASSKNGSVNVYLPSSFAGPITLICKHGSIKKTSAVAVNMSIFFEANDVQKGFLGDHKDWAADPENWKGDELIVETTDGSIRLFYVEEKKPQSDSASSGSSARGFWSKMISGFQ